MIRILIADSESAAREQLRAHLASDPEVEIVGLARDGQEALQTAHQLRPDIALLAADLAVQDGYQTAEMIASARALPTASVVLAGEPSAETMRKAMRAGARECLPRSISRKALLAAIHEIFEEEQRRLSPQFQEAADPNKVARMLSVTGAKGGIGKTTISTNLAVSLAQETGEPVVLVDLYTQFGDVAMLLNLAPRRTLADLAALKTSEIDAQLLEDAMERHSSGLRVLFGSKSPMPLDSISVPCLEHVINLLKGKYRYIVLDVPPILHATTLYVISHATAIVLVANLFDLTTFKDTRQLFDTIGAKYISRDRIKIVINRVGTRNRLQLSDIERAIGHAVDAQIPNDGKIVPSSINQGVPFIISKPSSSVAVAVRQLARNLAGMPVAGGDMPASLTSKAPLARRKGLFLSTRPARDEG